jgi:hypothetical protein
MEFMPNTLLPKQSTESKDDMPCAARKGGMHAQPKAQIVEHE